MLPYYVHILAMSSSLQSLSSVQIHLNICTVVTLTQGCNLNNFINSGCYHLFTNLEHRLQLPLFQMRSLNEMTGEVAVSLYTNRHDKLLLDWNISEAKFSQQLPIPWTESTLQEAPVLITLHVLCPVSYVMHSYSRLEVVAFSIKSFAWDFRSVVCKSV